MGHKLSIGYREHIEETLRVFVENCERCNDTWDMKQSALNLLGQLEQYTQKH